MLSPVFVFCSTGSSPISPGASKSEGFLKFFRGLNGDLKMWYDEKNEKQENPMPNDLPTDRLPTMAETRAMHEQAVRARKKQRLQKRSDHRRHAARDHASCRAGAFVRAKLQTLDKPLDAKTNQTAQTQPQEPLIEPASQASEQPEPETPEAEPEADTLPESETEPAQDAPEESESEETPAPEASSEKTYAPARVTEATKTLDLSFTAKTRCSSIWSRTPSWSRKTPTRASTPPR